MSMRVWGLLVLLSVLWGGSFLFNRLAVVDIPTATLVFVRLAIAAAALVVVQRRGGHPLPRGFAAWRGYAVMGLLGNVIPFLLIVWAQRTIDAGLASILNATVPIFGVIVAHLFTHDEKATPNRIAGVVLGLGGVVVLVGPGALAGAGGHVLAEAAVVLAAIVYSFAAVWSRRFRGSSPVTNAVGQLVAAAVVMLPVSLAVDRPWTLPMPGVTATLAVIALALLSTALAYVIYFRIVALAGASNVMLVTLLIPASAILLSAIVLGERLDGQQFAGLVVIACGLVAIDGRVFAILRRRRAG